MASQPSTEQDQGDPERQPLLADRRDPEDAPRSESRAKKTLAWFARHAVLIFISLLFIAVVVILVGFVKQSQAIQPVTETCMTPSCIHASSEILYNLNPNYKDIDPCTDFRQLTCGGWDERHDLRPDQGDAFTGTIMAEESQMLLRHILEAPYPDESKHSSFSPARLVEPLSSVDQDNFNKLKSAYDACMNEDAIKKEGIKPLMKILHSVVAAFPLTPSSPPDEQDVAGAIDLLARLGVSALVAFGTGPDDKDPDVVVVRVASPNPIGLPAKDYYKDDNVVQSYEATLTQVLEALHPAPKGEHSNAYASWMQFDQIKKYAHEVVELEKKLAAASPDAEDRDDVNKYYNPMSLSDANLLTPQIHLSTTINRFAPPDVKVDRLIVMAPQYMKSLSTIISDTPKEVLHSYFMWKVIQAYASAVDADELKPYSRFKNQIQGKDPDSSPERWRTCVQHVDGGIGFILSRFFVEKAFSAKAKDLGDRIVSDIKEMFIEKLKITSWMDKDVVDLAIEKVHKIVQKIGYPTKSPNIMDPPSLRDYYGSLDVTSSFFDNHLEINSFDFSREWSSLGKPVDRDRWDMTVPTVNAYYNPPGNEIVFPAGIMQFPVFDVELPQYISYGAFGSVSGHELSHAFDSTGRHYDQNGNYTDWWTNSTVTGFTERADCFVDQYHNFTIPGANDEPIHVNGKLTLGENIADAGGVSAAFAAWKKRRAETPNKDLPGLDHFTQEQLFFVSYGNWWCGKSRKEAAISRIYTDPHSPVWARILGTMANSRDFRESFNCPVKEPVCELW